MKRFSSIHTQLVDFSHPVRASALRHLRVFVALLAFMISCCPMLCALPEPQALGDVFSKFLARQGASAPSPPELDLLRRFTEGKSELESITTVSPEFIVCSGEESKIRALLIIWLLTSEDALQSWPRNGLAIKGYTILGDLDCRGVRISKPLTFRQCEFQGRILLAQATLFSLSLDLCVTPQIQLYGARIEKDLVISMKGAAVLEGATIGGECILTSSQFTGALLVGRLTCGSLGLRNVRAGSVKMNRSALSGNLEISGMQLLEGGFSISNSTIGGGILTLGSPTMPRVTGDFEFDGVKVGQLLDLSGLSVGGKLRFSYSDCSNDFLVSRSRIDSEMRIIGSRIQGQLIAGAADSSRIPNEPTLVCPRIVLLDSIIGGLQLRDISTPGESLVMIHRCKITSIDALSIHPQFPSPNSVLDLRATHAGTFDFDTRFVFGGFMTLHLDGFTYDHILSLEKWGTDALAGKVLEFIHLDPASPQTSFTQAATILANSGYSAASRQVLLAREETLTSQTPAFSWRRIWRVIVGWSIGYGYGSLNLVPTICVLVLLFAAWLWQGGDSLHIPLSSTPAEHRFHPLLFAVDVFFPGIDLQQEKYFLIKGRWNGIMLMFFKSAGRLSIIVIGYGLAKTVLPL